MSPNDGYQVVERVRGPDPKTFKQCNDMLCGSETAWKLMENGIWTNTFIIDKEFKGRSEDTLKSQFNFCGECAKLFAKQPFSDLARIVISIQNMEFQSIIAVKDILQNNFEFDPLPYTWKLDGFTSTHEKTMRIVFSGFEINFIEAEKKINEVLKNSVFASYFSDYEFTKKQQK